MRDAGTPGEPSAPSEPRSSEPAASPDHASTSPQKPDEEDAGLACEPLSKPRSVSYPKCSASVCPAQDSVCVPGSAVQALGIPFATATALPQCEDGSKCVATAIVEQAGHVRLQSCKSTAGVEGRCVSTCMPLAAAGDWPQDGCLASERCAPCYDPRDGRATGACGLGCDRGPSEGPRMLQSCCGGHGQCSPAPTDGSKLKLPRDGCDADLVCVPESRPKTCSSVDGAEGRCLSKCVGNPTRLPELSADGCGNEEVCTPCYDPITGADTGACTLHGDAPTKPVHRFERCCDAGREVAAGLCVPNTMARARFSDLLRSDTCSRGHTCVPTAELLDPNYQYPLCLGVGLGVCMPSCLFDPLNALLFTNLTCGRGDVCVPCSPLIGGCD